MRTAAVPRPELKSINGGVFPLTYLTGFLDFLVANRDTIEVITYADLPWGDDVDYEGHYPDERRAWVARRNPTKICVVLQHDVDTSPARTLRVLAEEDARGLRSCPMVFAQRHNRKPLRAERRLEFTDYEIEPAYLRRLADERGFSIGYHCNAVEQSLLNLEVAAERFRSDLAALRQRFDIRFFSHTEASRGLTASTTSRSWSRRTCVRRFAGSRTGTARSSTAPTATAGSRVHTAISRVATSVISYEHGSVGTATSVVNHPQYYADEAEPADELVSAAWSGAVRLDRTAPGTT